MFYFVKGHQIFTENVIYSCCYMYFFRTGSGLIKKYFFKPGFNSIFTLFSTCLLNSNVKIKRSWTLVVYLKIL